MSVSESAARAASDRGETRDDDAEYLRRMMPPGTTVYTVLRTRSRSGMSRVISCFVVGRDGKGETVIQWVPSPRIARVLPSARDDTKRDGNRVGGTGMDMGWWLVHELARVLYTGRGLTARQIAEASGRFGAPGDDPAYVLGQRWL